MCVCVAIQRPGIVGSKTEKSREKNPTEHVRCGNTSGGYTLMSVTVSTHQLSGNIDFPKDG